MKHESRIEKSEQHQLFLYLPPRLVWFLGKFPHFLFSRKREKMFIEGFKVESPNVRYTENEIHSVYNYETTELVHENRKGTYQWIVKPKTVKYEFKTNTRVPKLGFGSHFLNPPFFSFQFKYSSIFR